MYSISRWVLSENAAWIRWHAQAYRKYNAMQTPLKHKNIHLLSYMHRVLNVTCSILHVHTCTIILVKSFNTYTRVVREAFAVIRWSSTAYTSEIQTPIKPLYIHKHIHTCIVIHVQTPQTLRNCTHPSTHHTCIHFYVHVLSHIHRATHTRYMYYTCTEF